MLKTEAGKDVPLLPTSETTLLIEAGCSAEKTRQLLAWLKGECDADPDMPIIFVTCRKTHADDLYATVESFGLGGFKNYLDARGKADSKTAYMSDAKRLIVSMQSLHLVDLSLYKGGIVVVDEVRSAMSIPGGETLPQPTVQLQQAFRTLCTHAKHRVLMDADVSADGAVEAGLRIIAPMFDVLHVQLQRAALKRVMSLSYSGPKGSAGKANWEARLKLWLLRVRWVRSEWAQAQRAKMHAASAVLWLLEQRWARMDDENGKPSADLQSERERARVRLRKRAGSADVGRAHAIRWLLLHRERQWQREDEVGGAADGGRKSVRDAERARLRELGLAARFDRQRVLVCCATPDEAKPVAKMCDALGVAYHYYSGSTCDIEKREHFKNTTAHWFDAAVVIATTTMTVAVNVRMHFSVAFLWCRRAEQAGRLRELLQALVRVGRDEYDPLEDECIYALIPGEPPDFTTFKPKQQEVRFKKTLQDLKGESATKTQCEHAARVCYQRVAGGFDDPTPVLDGPLLSLLAWNRLESSDNCSNMATVKLIELCKLPTRAWPVQLTPPLTDPEVAESERLAKEEAPVLPAQAEDKMVGKMSMSEKYAWLHSDIAKRAGAAAREEASSATVDVSTAEFEQRVESHSRRLKEEYLAEQEGFRCSEVAQLPKNARGMAKEKIYQVIEPIGCLPDPCELDFGKLAQDDTMAKLERRAAAMTMPLDEQRKVYERERRKGKSAHPMVTTPCHTQTELLQSMAEELVLPIDRLLGPTTFTDQDDWVALYNRRKRNEPSGKKADEDRVKAVLTIAKALGVKVTSQMGLQKIVARVLEGVLKLKPSNPVERRLEQAPRPEQLSEWVIEEEWAQLIPKIGLPLLRPDGFLEKRVPQAEWLDRFRKLQAEAEEQARQASSCMDVDEEEQLDADMRAADGGGQSFFQPNLSAFVGPSRRLDEYYKVEKFDLDGICKALTDLRRDEAERERCSTDVSERLALERQKLGPENDFKAAGVALLALNESGERCVLFAKERRPLGVSGIDKLNFIGGKREGNETARETAAREAAEECPYFISDRHRKRLENDSDAVRAECWVSDSKYVLFAYEIDDQPNMLETLVAALEPPFPECPGLLGFELVSLRTLLDPAWAKANLHSFCKPQLKQLLPWLQQYLEHGAGAPPARISQLAPAEKATVEAAVQQLEGWYHALMRCDGMHAILQQLQPRRGDAGAADGRLHLRVEYEHKGSRGRRWAKGEPLPRRPGERRERTATLQSMHSDLRPVLVGQRGHDIDCENGDFRLIASFPAKYGVYTPIPYVCSYVGERGQWLAEIQRIHGVDEKTAKRLPNIVSNGGSYRTWLDQNALPRIPRSQWFQPVLRLQKELLELRKELFEHPEFKSLVGNEGARLRSESAKSEFGIEASLMSRIVQTCEDEVLRIVDRVFFNCGWDTLALVFDGLIVEPSAAVPTEDRRDLEYVLRKAEQACEAQGWRIKLAEKPLHGLQQAADGRLALPPSVEKARTAVREFNAFLAQLGR